MNLPSEYVCGRLLTGRTDFRGLLVGSLAESGVRVLAFKMCLRWCLRGRLERTLFNWGVEEVDGLVFAGEERIKGKACFLRRRVVKGVGCPGFELDEGMNEKGGGEV